MAAQAEAIILNPGVTPGLTLHITNARDYAFCEIIPVGTTAEFYQTTGTTGPEADALQLRTRPLIPVILRQHWASVMCR